MRGLPILSVASILLLSAVGLFRPYETLWGIGGLFIVCILMAVVTASSPNRLATGKTQIPELTTSQSILKLPKIATLFWVALVLRLIANFAINGSGLNWALAPDSEHYYSSGSMIADTWTKGIELSTWLGVEEGRIEMEFYRIFNAVFVLAFGETGARYLVPIVNSVVGLLGIWIAAKFVRDCWGDDESRIFFLLVAFMPSFLLWTSINLREAWAYMFLASGVFCVHRLRLRFSPKYLVLLFLAIYGASHIRSYLIPMVVAAMIPATFTTRLRYLPLTLAGSVGLTFLGIQIAEANNLDLSLGLTGALEEVDRLRTALTGGGSDYAGHSETSLAFLPKGLTYFLFAPFPWKIRSALQASSIPETIVWYGLFAVGIKGLLFDMRKRFRHVVLPFSLEASRSRFPTRW